MSLLPNMLSQMPSQQRQQQFYKTSFGPNIVADYSTQNPSYYDVSSGTPQRVAVQANGQYMPWDQATRWGIDHPELNGGNAEGTSTGNPWETAVGSQGTNPSRDFGFEKYALPAMMMATGFGAAGMGPLAGAGAGASAGAGAGEAIAPWGAGEAVSGTYPGLETAGEVSTAGGGANETGAFDQYGSRSYPDAGTNQTVFDGNTGTSPMGASPSAWDTIRQGIQMVNTVAPVIGLGASIAGYNQANQTAGKLQSSLDSTYPYSKNFDLVDQYNRDPMSLLRNNPGYLASVDYTAKAQARDNARMGRNTSGYGDFLMADVLGKNAENWWKDQWQPIRDSAGLTNPGAQLNAQTNAINSINNTKRTSLADMWNQGTKVATQTLPEIFKWLS